MAQNGSHDARVAAAMEHSENPNRLSLLGRIGDQVIADDR